MDDVVTIGRYTVPWALSIVLAFLYSQMTLSDRVKNLIAVLCGIGFGLLAIWVGGNEWTPINVVEHILYGFNAGLTAVGFWKTINIQFRHQ